MKNKKLPGIFTALLLVGVIFNLRAQYALQVTQDTTICRGQSVQLNVSGGSTYMWTPSATLSSSTSASPVATPAQTTTYVVTSQLQVANMAINGNFNLGDTGFTTAYTYEALDNNGQQKYYVGTSPSSFNNLYTNCSAYTGGGGNGNMMLVNGAETLNTPVWCETFQSYPNSTYNLSGYITPLDNTNLPEAKWMVNGTPIGSQVNTLFTCIPQQFTATWNSGTYNGQVTFCAFDVDTFADGNDFALNDMVISATLTLTDTVVVTVIAPPVVNLGNDTMLCTAQTLTLNASYPSSTYLWNNNSTAPNITVSGAGVYWVQVNNGCSVRDSITVAYSAVPAPFTLGNDTSYCGNFSRILSTGYANTLWSTSANGSQITVTTSGSYWATEANQCGIASDTIIIGQTAAPAVNLGLDTAICSAQIVTFDAGNAGATYNWSNNTHNETLSTNTPGTYSVTVTSIAGCSAAAAVVVSNYNVPLSVTSTNTSCGTNNGSATTVITNGRGPYQYIWSSNNATTPGISGLASGSYDVTVTDSNGCTASASASVAASGANSVSVTASSTLICPNDTAALCATTGFIAYNWSNADTTPCISTSLAGDYSVTVTDGGNCTASSGNTNIQVRQPPTVTVSVIGDTLTSYSASTYQWYLNDTLIPGATSGTYIAQVSGNYTVIISDSHGCTATSSVVHVVISGIGKILTGDNIKVFPNPLEDGNWMLQVDESILGGIIQLFDDNGRMVYRSVISSTQMELNLNAARGIYLMRVMANDQYFTSRLVKL